VQPKSKRRRRAAVHHRSRRGCRSARGSLGPGGGGRGRPPPLAHRTTGYRQDHARSTSTRPAAAPGRPGVAGGHRDSLRRRAAEHRAATHHATGIRRAAPHQHGQCLGGRWLGDGAARRGEPGPPRRAVSRRIPRIRRPRVGGTAHSAGGRRGAHRPTRRGRALPGAIPTGARGQPMPVRAGAGTRLRVSADGAPPLPGAVVGAAAGPGGPTGADAPACRGRSHRRSRGKLGRSPSTGCRRPGRRCAALGQSRVAHQRGGPRTSAAPAVPARPHVAGAPGACPADGRHHRARRGPGAARWHGRPNGVSRPRPVCSVRHVAARAQASGPSRLEAISNGVGAFQRPEGPNARRAW